MDVGTRIRELRESRDWTTNRLANLCGLSQSFLRAVEMGEKGISVEKLELICDVFPISLRQFFDVKHPEDNLETTLMRQISSLDERQKESLSQFLGSMKVH